MRRAGWQGAGWSLSAAAVARGAQHYMVATARGMTDFQVSGLTDAANQSQGYLVLAQKHP